MTPFATFKLADRHLPLVGRGLEQHDARGSTAAADVVLRGADAAAAAGPHLAPGALAREIGAGRDLLGRHLLPVALELLGDELGEAGDRALAHLRARDADHAGVVGLDGDPYIDFGAVIGGALRHAAPKPDGRLNPSASPPPAAAEPTTNLRRESFADLSRMILFTADPLRFWTYRWPPCGRRCVRADRCRSDRCWSSPRRCPCRSAWAFFLSSAAAAMIWPDWQ